MCDRLGVLWTEGLHPPQPCPYVEALIPSVMVPGGGVFGRQLGLDKTVKVEPHDGISALIRRDRDQSPLSATGGHGKKAAVCKPGGGSHQTVPPHTPESVSTLDLPASRTVRSDCLLFKPARPWCFVTAGRAKTCSPSGTTKCKETFLSRSG